MMVVNAVKVVDATKVVPAIKVVNMGEMVYQPRVRLLTPEKWLPGKSGFEQ